jgi:hypothetical protein
MRGFHFTLTPILARVAGLGENIIPLLIWSGRLEIWPLPVQCLRENRSLGFFRKFSLGWFHFFVFRW